MPNLDPSSSANATTATGRDGVTPCGLEPGDGRQRRRHAERAVERAAAGHRVEVAADGDRAVAAGAPVRPDVAVPIELDRQPERLARAA